ncbi:MAG: DHH family phosphoesterase [Roseburia sp.]|nr:DHH family phosphoesterase [Roseburia sp.]MCM1280136.1 DHH family phosphoesterase [Robinsoniella sp.]
MNLTQLEKFHHIVIQCHDNPDADALASGFALYSYFKAKGKQVRFLYSGRFQIQKSNLVLMKEELKIPVEYVESPEGFPVPELLIMTDCQYGTGNVTRFPGKRIAVIDHHQREMPLVNGTTNGITEEAGEEIPIIEEDFIDIRSNYGSCSTIVWQLLSQAGFEVNESPLLATALYYGLYMDTGQLGDVYYPVDRDMRDELLVDKGMMNKLKNSNISQEELEIAGEALIHNHHKEDLHFSIVKVRPCDPNILGIISDFVLQTDVVDTCVIYCPLGDGYKLSFRSCDKEIKASDMAAFFTKGIGSGGGHGEKAGGFISKRLYEEQYKELELEQFFYEKMKEYVHSYQVIYAKDYQIDTSDMVRYKKKKLPLGYVVLTDIYPEGTPIIVRTLEGDLEIQVQEDIYLMIGIQGEVYPIKKEKFFKSYEVLPCPYDVETEYIPSVHNQIKGTSEKVTGFAGNICRNKGGFYQSCRIFTRWEKGIHQL